MPGSPDMPTPPPAEFGVNNANEFRSAMQGASGGRQHEADWPQNQEQLNQRVQEWAGRVKAAEQAGQTLREGQQSTPGIMNEPMSGAFKIR